MVADGVLPSVTAGLKGEGVPSRVHTGGSVAVKGRDGTCPQAVIRSMIRKQASDSASGSRRRSLGLGYILGIVPLLIKALTKHRGCIIKFVPIGAHLIKSITLDKEDAMQAFNFDEVIERRFSDSYKWNSYPPEVLPLWVADMDFPSPPAVVEALQRRVAHGIFGYPDWLRNQPEEAMALRELITERLYRLYRWRVHTHEILFLPGVIPGLNLASHAFAVPNGGVLVQTPVYPPILQVARTTGAVPQEAPLQQNADGSYTIDFEALERAITPQTRLFILCNPHNPVGRVFRREELEKIAEICLRKGVIICADEIHSDLIYSGYSHLPIASLSPEVAFRTITLMAPSKTFNLPGLQCAFAIVPDAEMRKTLLAARRGLIPWVNLLGIIAAQAAYQHGEAWLQALLAYLQDNRDFLVHYAQQHLPNIHITPPQGTYLAWLDCRAAHLPDGAYQFFLDKAHLAFNDGVTFGKEGEGFVRMNFACPRKTLAEALNRMRTALVA